MISIFLERLKRIGLRKTIGLIISRLCFAVGNSQDITLRVCQCCGRRSLFARLGRTIDGVRCVRCGANFRYELLAKAINQRNEIFKHANCIVEFDPNSPLRRILETYGNSYKRTYFGEGISLGSISADGSACQDMQRLTYLDKSVDIMISSDVMEHVPDFELALSEIRRVLCDGGFYLFTVPMSEKTRQRSHIVNGQVAHIESPIYHLDPLNPTGALVFWDFGEDFINYFSRQGLSLNCVAQDQHGFRVWLATAGML